MAGEQKFTKLGATILDLEMAWQDRWTDAEALLTAGRFAGAIMDALYALEIRLKVLICKRLDLEALPKAFEIHDLDSLLLLAGLSRRLQRRSAVNVRNNWDHIMVRAQEINDIRYRPASNWSQRAAVLLFSQLRDLPDGVLPWLSKQ
jgi:hypothetical protein